MNRRLAVTAVAAIGLVIAINSLATPSGSEPVPVAAREPYVRTTRAAVEALKTNLKEFRFTLEYHGPDAAKFYSLQLSVSPLPDSLPPSTLGVRITEADAAVLIGHLANDGCLNRGTINRSKHLKTPDEPYYRVSVQGTARDEYHEFVPWGQDSYRWHWMTRPAMSQQLDGFRSVLTGEAAEAMDKLVGAVDTAQKSKKPRGTPAGTG